MAFTERYKIFLSLGGGKNYEYISFILKMKKMYLLKIKSNSDVIHNHDDFTDFIRNYAKTRRTK